MSWEAVTGLYEVLDTQVISSTAELKCNEWMTVFRFGDSDLREAGLGSLPHKLKKQAELKTWAGSRSPDPL